MPTAKGSKTTRAPRVSPADKARADMLASVLACPRSADIARLLGVPGKTLRGYVRGTLGVFVSRGGVLTDEHKRAVFERFYRASTDAPAPSA